MWKIAVGFIAFAALALFVIMKGGDKIDMQGEQAGHNPIEAASAPASSSGTTSASVPAATPATSAPAPK